MQVGKTKDQGLYNKPSAAVHAGALAAGTLPQYNIIHLRRHWSSVSCISHIGMKIERILLAISAKHKVRPTENNVMCNKV